MRLDTVKGELYRPLHRGALLLYATLVIGCVAMTWGWVAPAKEEASRLEQELAVARMHRQVQEQLADHADQLRDVQHAVPRLAEKLQWQGSQTAFSRAVLDAASLAEVSLAKEVNDVGRGGERPVYKKTVELTADYGGLLGFLDELAALEILVVPASIVVEGGENDLLDVTLVLTAYPGAGS